MVETMDRNRGNLAGRMVACKADGVTVPAMAFGLIKSMDSNGLALIGQPDADSISAGRLVVTMPGPDLVSGTEFYALPADSGNLSIKISGTDPAVDGEIGTESGNWYAVKDKTGFKVNGVSGGHAIASPFRGGALSVNWDAGTWTDFIDLGYPGYVPGWPLYYVTYEGTKQNIPINIDIRNYTYMLLDTLYGTFYILSGTAYAGLSVIRINFYNAAGNLLSGVPTGGGYSVTNVMLNAVSAGRVNSGTYFLYYGQIYRIGGWLRLPTFSEKPTSFAIGATSTINIGYMATTGTARLYTGSRQAGNLPSTLTVQLL